MARFFLLNNTLLGTNRIYAGTLVDDAQEDVASIRAAGGVLVHENSGEVAAAAAEAATRRGRADAESIGVLMLAAAVGALDVAPKGANLTNASVTIQLSEGRRRTLPAATLAANQVLTLGVAGTPAPRRGARILITRLDAGAFTYTINNGGAGGAGAGSIVLPVSIQGFAEFEFDATNWEPIRFGRL